MAPATKTTEALKTPSGTKSKAASDRDVTEVPGNIAEQALQIPIDILKAVSDGLVGIFDTLRGEDAKKAS